MTSADFFLDPVYSIDFLQYGKFPGPDSGRKSAYLGDS